MSTVDSPPLEFLQGTLEVLILRSLQIAPNHAFGIARFIEQQSEAEFAVDHGDLYPGFQGRRFVEAMSRVLAPEAK